MHGHQERFVSYKEGGMQGAHEQETNVCAAVNRERRKPDLTHLCSSCAVPAAPQPHCASGDSETCKLHLPLCLCICCVSVWFLTFVLMFCMHILEIKGTVCKVLGLQALCIIQFHLSRQNGHFSYFLWHSNDFCVSDTTQSVNKSNSNSVMLAHNCVGQMLGIPVLNL